MRVYEYYEEELNSYWCHANFLDESVLQELECVDTLFDYYVGVFGKSEVGDVIWVDDIGKWMEVEKVYEKEE